MATICIKSRALRVYFNAGNVAAPACHPYEWEDGGNEFIEFANINGVLARYYVDTFDQLHRIAVTKEEAANGYVFEGDLIVNEEFDN